MRTKQRRIRDRRDPRAVRFAQYRRAVLPDLMDVDGGELVGGLVSPPPCDPVRDMQALVALIELEGVSHENQGRAGAEFSAETRRGLLFARRSGKIKDFGEWARALPVERLERLLPAAP